MKNLIGTAIFLLTIFGIAFVSGGLGTFQQDTCVDIRTILNTTAVNMSSISLPNNTVLYLDQEMTANAKTFNYTYCGTDLIGEYIYDYYDNEGNVYVNDFEITYTGKALTNSMSILYTSLLAVLVLLLFLTVAFISKLPSNNETSETGRILKVSYLKHIRKSLWGLVYLFVWGIVFVSANLSIAYLPTGMIGKLLFAIAMAMGWIGIPILIILFLRIFDDLLEDRKIKQLLDRGIFVENGKN